MMRPNSKLLRRESTTSCSARYGLDESTAYSRIVRNWIIYFDMSGLIARKHPRPLEQPPIAARAEPLAGVGGMFFATADGRRPHLTVAPPPTLRGGARLGLAHRGRMG